MYNCFVYCADCRMFSCDIIHLGLIIQGDSIGYRARIWRLPRHLTHEPTGPCEDNNRTCMSFTCGLSCKASSKSNLWWTTGILRIMEIVAYFNNSDQRLRFPENTWITVPEFLLTRRLFAGGVFFSSSPNTQNQHYPNNRFRLRQDGRNKQTKKIMGIVS